MSKEKAPLEIKTVYEFEKKNNKVEISAIPADIRGETVLYVGICELRNSAGSFIPKCAVTFEASHIKELKSMVEKAMEIDNYGEVTELGTFEKNSREQIQVSGRTYRGTEYLDIRTYYKDAEGSYKPSKKGVTIPPDILEDLLEGLTKFEETYLKEEKE